MDGWAICSGDVCDLFVCLSFLSMANSIFVDIRFRRGRECLNCVKVLG